MTDDETFPQAAPSVSDLPTVEDGSGAMDTPETYPAECTISADELQELKATLTNPDNEDWRSYAYEWPMRDDHGNVYPIWFTVDDLTDSRGELVDSNGNDYSPFTGNREPRGDRWDYCNAPLNNWRERYPNVRYCSVALYYDVEKPYCHHHKGRDNTVTPKTAEETIQTGLFTKTIDHLYEKLGPWKQLVGWGTFESLMGESAYEFGVEFKEREFDFSETEVHPDGVDEDGILTVRCGYPTDHLDPALSLYVAAMMGVQMLTVQPRIMFEDREQGEGMMESRTIEAAQLTAPPSEHDPSPQEFKTLETWSEHHLNLPLSRLVTDRPKLLERGGVSPDAEDNDTDVDADEIVLEIDADPEGIDTTDDDGTDPNQFGDDMTSESEKIRAAVETDE